MEPLLLKKRTKENLSETKINNINNNIKCLSEDYYEKRV